MEVCGCGGGGSGAAGAGAARDLECFLGWAGGGARTQIDGW